MNSRLMACLRALLGAGVGLVWIYGNAYGADTPAPGVPPGTPGSPNAPIQGVARPARSPMRGANSNGTLPTPPAGTLAPPSVGAPAVGGNLTAPNPQQPAVGGSLTPPQTGAPPAGGKLTPPNATTPPVGGPIGAPATPRNAGVVNPGSGVGTGAGQVNRGVGTSGRIPGNAATRDPDDRRLRPSRREGNLQPGKNIEFRAIPSTHGTIFTTNGAPAAPTQPNTAAPK